MRREKTVTVTCGGHSVTMTVPYFLSRRDEGWWETHGDPLLFYTRGDTKEEAEDKIQGCMQTLARSCEPADKPLESLEKWLKRRNVPYTIKKQKEE